jgi:hypothetical protein
MKVDKIWGEFWVADRSWPHSGELRGVQFTVHSWCPAYVATETDYTGFLRVNHQCSLKNIWLRQAFHVLKLSIFNQNFKGLLF